MEATTQAVQFNVGDRAILKTWKRHGKVNRLSSYTVSTTSYMIGTQSTPEKTVERIERCYFLSDEGYEFYCNMTDLETEVIPPTVTIPDPMINGKPDLPWSVWNKIESLPNTIKYEEEKARKARTRKQEWLRSVERTKADLEQHISAFEQWERDANDPELVRSITGETEAEYELRKLMRSPSPDSSRIAELKRQIKADIEKWNIGDGVAYKDNGEVIRGYRIYNLNRESKTALLELVDSAEHPHLEPGSKKWNIKFGNLIRDPRYDATDEERGLEEVSVSLTDTAKMIREHLKRDYPGFKFSVVCDSYSMGSSIDVTWTDGPDLESIEAICSQYNGAVFDGSQDLESYVTHVRDNKIYKFSVDYVTPRRKMSKTFVLSCIAPVCEEYGKPLPEIQGTDDDCSFYVLGDDYWFSRELSEAVCKTSAYICQTEEVGEAKAIAQGVTINHNTEKSGIEISFSDKPSSEVIEKVKSLGFRWSKFQKLWYAKHSDSLWSRTHALFAVEVEQPQPEVEPETETAAPDPQPSIDWDMKAHQALILIAQQIENIDNGKLTVFQAIPEIELIGKSIMNEINVAQPPQSEAIANLKRVLNYCWKVENFTAIHGVAIKEIRGILGQPQPAEVEQPQQTKEISYIQNQRVLDEEGKIQFFERDYGSNVRLASGYTKERSLISPLPEDRKTWLDYDLEWRTKEGFINKNDSFKRYRELKIGTAPDPLTHQTLKLREVAELHYWNPSHNYPYYLDAILADKPVEVKPVELKDDVFPILGNTGIEEEECYRELEFI